MARRPAVVIPRSDRLSHLVGDAMRALIRGLQLRLSDGPISYGHWAFLRILWHQDGLSQRMLARRAGLSEPTTSAALDALETLGLVERRAPPGGRRPLIRLTAEGRALETRLLPFATDVNRAALRGIPALDLAATCRTLEAMVDNLGPPADTKSRKTS
ncbi:MAG: MarR family transcriptional regulator [Alphaproteobacteria bacterium]|jgi:DNA-binding MarR family transcriptional regulator|nr:MarR family transcriptional regulator [Alphaproteobacteria bacterium]